MKKGILFFLSLVLVIFSCSNPTILQENKEEQQTTKTMLAPEKISFAVVYSTVIGLNHPSTGVLSPVNEASWATATWTKGANFNGVDLEIGVYAPSATKLLLEVYEVATGSNAAYDYWMQKGSDGVWRAKLAQAPDKTLYAFRAWGPNWTFNSSWARGNSNLGFVTDVDSQGNRFNPNKVLFDPYAKELSHDKETPAMTAAGEDGGMYGTGSALYKTVIRREYDTGKWSPKSVALKADGVSFGMKPQIADKDNIIYEAHVKGLTNSDSVTNLTTILSGISGFETIANVPAAYKGTYKGAGYMAKYLKALGYTTIELLPIQETANDNNPTTSSGGNFWGYMTYGYFAPDRKYSYDKSLGGPTKEFKEMVKAFHDTGMEVYLDVVYNHTGEGGTWASKSDTREITSFSGLANQYYYRLTGTNNEWYYDGTTGCGNQVNGNSDASRGLIIDSLTYWLDVMGIDGFRFDLAYTLGRRADLGYAYDPNAPVLLDIQNLGQTKNAEMIAEAWDCQGAGVSSFPPKWGDWNGDYRDVMRKFIKGDGYKPGTYYSFGDVFYGTYNGYYDGGQGGPQKSINFLVAHDGFTLTDLVSYNLKYNTQVWPWGPSDGGNDNNLSWDCGGSQSLRRQQVKNLWAIQMFSRGTPMSVYGDEFGRTQNGNNNVYNLDSIATWNNYNMINTDSPDTVMSAQGQHNNLGTDGHADGKNGLFLFTKFVNNLRKNHVALRQGDYSVPITIKKEDGATGLTDADKCVWVRIDGSTKGDSDFLVFVNTYTAQVSYKVPKPEAGKKWVRIIDTATWAEANDNYWDSSTGWSPATDADQWYGVFPRTVVVFEKVASVTDTTPPTVSVTAPTNNATVSGTITISANASDNIGVTKVEFYVGNALIGTDTTSPYSISLNTTTTSEGTNTIKAKAYDDANNSTEASVNVTVSNGTSGRVRTVVFMQKETVSGQDIFVKGGHDSGLVPTYYPSMSEPIIYNNTINTTTAAIKANDGSLDWGSESALDWTCKPGTSPYHDTNNITYANSGYGVLTQKTYGECTTGNWMLICLVQKAIGLNSKHS